MNQRGAVELAERAFERPGDTLLRWGNAGMLDAAGAFLEPGFHRIPTMPERLGGGLYVSRNGRVIPPIAGGAGESIYWNESIGPGSASIADEGNVTPTTTMKAFWNPVNVGQAGALRANFWQPGRMVRVMAAVKLAIGATPGNIAFGMGFGSATTPDNPACIVTSTAKAGTASQTVTAFLIGVQKCRSDGTAGTLSQAGFCITDAVAIATNANTFPSGGTTVVSTIDTTVGTNCSTFQTSYSGATPGTVALLELDLAVLN